jgi:hypothetical protein
MLRYQIDSWFLCVTEFLTDITLNYALNVGSVRYFQMHALMVFETNNTVFPNINVCRWNLYNILFYFPEVYLTTLLVANKIILLEITVDHKI